MGDKPACSEFAARAKHATWSASVKRAQEMRLRRLWRLCAGASSFNRELLSLIDAGVAALQPAGHRLAGTNSIKAAICPANRR